MVASLRNFKDKISAYTLSNFYTKHIHHTCILHSLSNLHTLLILKIVLNKIFWDLLPVTTRRKNGRSSVLNSSFKIALTSLMLMMINEDKPQDILINVLACLQLRSIKCMFMRKKEWRFK